MRPECTTLRTLSPVGHFKGLSLVFGVEWLNDTPDLLDCVHFTNRVPDRKLKSSLSSLLISLSKPYLNWFPRPLNPLEERQEKTPDLLLRGRRPKRTLGVVGHLESRETSNSSLTPLGRRELLGLWRISRIYPLGSSLSLQEQRTVLGQKNVCVSEKQTG